MKLAAVFAAAALALAQDRADSRYENAKFGFRWSAPSAEWKLNEKPEGDTAVTVYLTAHGTTGAWLYALQSDAHVDAEAVRASSLAKVRAAPGYRDPEESLLEIGGARVPTLRFTREETDGSVFRVEQHYWVDGDRIFVMQCYSLASEFESSRGLFASIEGAFERLPEPGGDASTKALRDLAARCGSELVWAPSWTAAAERARTEHKPVLTVVWRYGGFSISDSASASTFMDPDVVELVAERFVPLRLRNISEAPFAEQARFGLSATTFGAAMLVCSPDGDVIEQSPRLEPIAAYEFLLQAIARHPEWSSATPEVAGDSLERAAAAMRRGDLARAEKLLDEPRTPNAWLLRASLMRRERRGDEALAALDRACDRITLAAQVAAQRASVLLRMGRTVDARDAIEAALADPAAADATPELLYERAICAAQLGHIDEARKLWQRVVAEHGESRWAWKSAATLTGTALELGYVEPTRWPEKDLLDSVRILDRKRAPDPARAERDALEWLLAAQQPDGSWFDPTQLGSSPESMSNPFVPSITALAGRALLQRGLDGKRRAAVEHALAFVLRAHRALGALESEPKLLDYSVWERPCAIQLLADCLDARVGDAGELRSAMGEMVAALAKMQLPTGGWSYFLSGDLAERAKSSVSVSFVTAAAVLALVRAREFGIEVDDAMLARALDRLEALRNENGAFDYMGAAAGATVSEGAGRGPVCELALLAGGRGSVERVRKSLEQFVAESPHLTKEIGKALMHAGPEGQGCHYVAFDFAMAAEAVRALPAAERPKLRAHIEALVMPMRLSDGSFEDTPVLGRTTGTALALLALH